MDTANDRLTEREKKERRDWDKTLVTIQQHYYGNELQPPRVTSKEGVLRQRLIAPRMEPTNVTRRTGLTEARAGRMYPHATHVEVWMTPSRRLPNISSQMNLSKVNMRDSFLFLKI